VIGRVFKELKMIEQWGSGIRRMETACREMGLPAPTFEEYATRFRVTLRLVAEGPRAVEGLDADILEILADGKGWNTARIAASIGISPRATRTRLNTLVERGLVVVVGKSAKDPRRRYFLARKAEGSRP
jgi:predicted HTH transcriptional regulator